MNLKKIAHSQWGRAYMDKTKNAHTNNMIIKSKPLLSRNCERACVVEWWCDDGGRGQCVEYNPKTAFDFLDLCTYLIFLGCELWLFPLEIHPPTKTKNGKLRFLGISRCKFKLKIWSNLNLYRGIWVFRSANFGEGGHF